MSTGLVTVAHQARPSPPTLAQVGFALGTAGFGQRPENPHMAQGACDHPEPPHSFRGQGQEGQELCGHQDGEITGVRMGNCMEVKMGSSENEDGELCESEDELQCSPSALWGQDSPGLLLPCPTDPIRFPLGAT